MGAISNSLYQMVSFGLEDNYFNTFPEKVRALTLEDVSAIAKSTVKPGNMVWVIVGDRAKIEEGIRSLNLGVVQALDADGNPVAAERAGAGGSE
jgi:zinc protease